MNFLAGRKTIITGIVMIIYAISGLLLGNIELNTAVEIGGTGAGIIFLRLGMK